MVFTLFASTSFLLIVIVALFAGDTVPSEASWSSLRYLLAAPVRRERLLRQKLIVAALSSVVALSSCRPGRCWSAGSRTAGVRMSGRPGVRSAGRQFAGRLLIIVGYLLLELSVVAAFAFMLGVLTDAPLAAVGGAVLLMILCAILDSITGLGRHPRGPARPLRVRLGRRAGPDRRLLRHDHRRAVVGRLRHRAGRLRLLALPAQGHHELRCSAKKASIRRQASAAGDRLRPDVDSTSAAAGTAAARSACRSGSCDRPLDRPRRRAATPWARSASPAPAPPGRPVPAAVAGHDRARALPRARRCRRHLAVVDRCRVEALGRRQQCEAAAHAEADDADLARAVGVSPQLPAAGLDQLERLACARLERLERGSDASQP